MGAVNYDGMSSVEPTVKTDGDVAAGPFGEIIAEALRRCIDHDRYLYERAMLGALTQLERKPTHCSNMVPRGGFIKRWR